MTVATSAPPDAQHAGVSAPGYAIVPNGVLRDARLSLAARLLYAVLDGRQAGNSRKGVRVGVVTLAADLAVSESTLRRAAAELTDAGWLERGRTGRSNSWRLANPVRSSSRAAPVQQSLEDAVDSVPPVAGHAGARGELGRGPVGTRDRSVTGARSDQSPVTDLQRITSEDYNNSADPALASSQGRDQRSTGSSFESTESPTRASTGSEDRAAVGHGKTATAKSDAAVRTNDPVLARYLTEINAATGARLEPTRPLREMVRKIAAKGISAHEAAVASAAFLAAKPGHVYNPAGFLCDIVLPGMANGDALELQPPTPTPVPPAYRDLVAAETCTHGAEVNRCALCRRAGADPDVLEDAPRALDNPALAAVLAELGAIPEPTTAGEVKP